MTTTAIPDSAELVWDFECNGQWTWISTDHCPIRHATRAEVDAAIAAEMGDA